MNQQSKFVQPQVAETDWHEDEIDLFDLWDDIVSQKLMLAGVFVFCMLCAMLYLFIAKPVYQVETVLKPVDELDLVALNVPQLSGIYSLSVTGAYEQVKRAMLSQESQRNFYERNIEFIKGVDGLYNDKVSVAQNVSSFSRTIKTSLSNDKKDAETFINIKFELGDGVVAADLLNKYVDFVLVDQLEDVRRALEGKRLVRLNKLEYDASLIRDKYYNRKVQRKLQLEEAGGIAKSVGQIEPIYTNSDILGSFKPPLYMYGSRALSAEERALGGRAQLAKDLPHGEEHFIVGLPEILFEINQLKNLHIDYSEIKIAKVDEYALPPLASIKPKKLLILILSCVMSVFLGVMAALLVSAYQRHLRKNKVLIESGKDQ